MKGFRTTPVDGRALVRGCDSADELRAVLVSLKRDFSYARRHDLRALRLSPDSLAERRRWEAGIQAEKWARNALDGGGEELIATARRGGATGDGLRRLRSILCGTPLHAAQGLYERLAPSCDECGDTGHGAFGRCNCFRGQVIPAYRCPRCHDSGLILESGGATPCECRRRARRPFASSLLVTDSLVWVLPDETRRPAETFLRSGPDPERGTVVWLHGGQGAPQARAPADRYAGHGVARLCADRARAAGVPTRRMTPFDLLEEWRLGEGWFRTRAAILLDRPETALPTSELRAAIEALLADAWDWCGSVLIATDLPIQTPASTRPTWGDFTDRALETLARPAWRTLRSGLLGDPACPMLGDIHPLMLQPPNSSDYLTQRSRSLIAGMEPRDRPSLRAAA